ncbi:hypothetical protein N665_0198s0306 [Sinapis alba]|nr:hypothetical protein N665_0198s0306 [Sinapis alba]
MSACLSSGGGGAAAAAYSFELEKKKSPPQPPPSSSTTTRATSPSSTISESSNSPLAISTRKPRTPRKRPNQTYNEAAALLSTAYPNIFSSNNLYATKKTHSNPQLYEDASELLLLPPFESIEEPDFLFLPTVQARSEYFSELKEVNQFEFSDEFDAESILDEETEEGIDSIMGMVESSNSSENLISRLEQMMKMNRSAKGFSFFPLGLGLRSALREHNDASWLRFHTVDFEQISPRIQNKETPTEGKKLIGEKSEKKKKKKKKVPAVAAEKCKEDTEEKSGRLMLKLDYDDVLEAWSEKASPFSDEILCSEDARADVNISSDRLIRRQWNTRSKCFEVQRETSNSAFLQENSISSS